MAMPPQLPAAAPTAHSLCLLLQASLQADATSCFVACLLPGPDCLLVSSTLRLSSIHGLQTRGRGEQGRGEDNTLASRHSVHPQTQSRQLH